MAKQATPRKPKKQANKAFAQTYYIKGFGTVNVGEVASAAALEAWNKISESQPKLVDIVEAE